MFSSSTCAHHEVLRRHVGDEHHRVVDGQPRAGRDRAVEHDAVDRAADRLLLEVPRRHAVGRLGDLQLRLQLELRRGPLRLERLHLAVERARGPSPGRGRTATRPPSPAPAPAAAARAGRSRAVPARRRSSRRTPATPATPSRRPGPSSPPARRPCGWRRTRAAARRPAAAAGPSSRATPCRRTRALDELNRALDRRLHRVLADGRDRARRVKRLNHRPPHDLRHGDRRPQVVERDERARHPGQRDRDQDDPPDGAERADACSRPDYRRPTTLRKVSRSLLRGARDITGIPSDTRGGGETTAEDRRPRDDADRRFCERKTAGCRGRPGASARGYQVRLGGRDGPVIAVSRKRLRCCGDESRDAIATTSRFSLSMGTNSTTLFMRSRCGSSSRLRSGTATPVWPRR